MRLSTLTMPALLLVGLGVWLLLQYGYSPASADSGPVDPSEAARGAESAASESEAPSPAENPAKEEKEPRNPLGLTRNPPDPRKYLRCPDGTYAPALNGVDEPAPLNWPQDRPWSPIVRKTTDSSGLDWYVHADGTHTITQMTWHSQFQRMDAVTLVYNPVPTLPIHPDDLAGIERQQQKGKDSAQKKQPGKAGKQ
ncbi:MAG: hypothetical protein ACE5F1_21750 [Planctomycetota bacterium]